MHASLYPMSKADGNSNTLKHSREAMTKTALEPDHHHYKPSHHHHHDEETTAYSSWHDEEDSHSQLSSYLSSVDSHGDHAVCVGEEDEQFHRGSVILLSSSECSLLDNNDVEDEDIIAANDYCSSLKSDYGSLKVNKEEQSNKMLVFQELSEQASYLLQREGSPEYAVDDYFQRSYYDVDYTPCRSSAHESTSGIEYLIPSSTDNNISHRKSKPIDRSCRSIMMEWSYRVIEVSFPPPAAPQQQEHQQSIYGSTSQEKCKRRSIRQHSTESLQLICTTFSFIDRICTKFKVVDREEYKLLSMVCLNLAAKSSGLFCTDNERDWYEFFNHQDSDACCKHEHRSEHTVTTASLSSSSSSFDNIDSSSSKNSQYTGQTILSTPGQDDDDDAEIQGQLQRPRPLMDLISLPGLHALCNGLFTKEQFCEMEYIILHRGLDWRLNCVQAIDWLDLCLEISSLLHLEGNRCLAEDDCNDLREAAMVQLEYAVEISSFIGYAPSLLAVAAFLNAADGYSESEDYILDCIEEVFGVNFDRSEMVKVRNNMRM